jgi:hypothetical protein
MCSLISQEEPESQQLVRIGAGCFASVFIITGDDAIAFKSVHVDSNADRLLDEFESLKDLYSSCNSDSFFALPRALAHFEPASGALHVIPSSLKIHSSRRQIRSVVSTAAFRPFSDNASPPVYAMDRISALAGDYAMYVRDHIYPEKHRAAAAPKLCRLYFGKLPPDPNRRQPMFINSNNYPLYRTYYAELTQHVQGLHSIEEVAEGMGEMLGHIHWRRGFDARDIEFVLGGGSWSSSHFWVIDFNQVC